jgi:hypothetical protein
LYFAPLEMKTISTIILILFTSGNHDEVVRLQIEYLRTEDNQVWTNGIDEVTVKKKTRVIQKLFTSKIGLIEIRRDSIRKYGELDLYMTSTGMQELYLLSINSKAREELKIHLPRHYQFRGKFALCPKCNKADKVLRAIYGEGQMLLRKISNRGDTIYTNKIGKDYYMGTCMVHELNPQWYCDRDNIAF